MQNHGNRDKYFIDRLGVVNLTTNGAGGFNVEVAAAAAGPVPQDEVLYKFGWMFARSQHTYEGDERDKLVALLSQLGTVMSRPAGIDADVSDISSGYTYLGQFIAHEISFDKDAVWPPQDAATKNYRSPEIDLDSLYGARPQADPGLYQTGAERAKLKVGLTLKNPDLNAEFPNDLPRDEETGRARIGDGRNDENLALAQTHVAFIAFHNKVVDYLRECGCPEAELFERAQCEVIRHFQWLIIHDYLPRLVAPRVLERVLGGELRPLAIPDGGELFMPLEFSVAALRIGHSMVRDTYEWNRYHFSRLFRRPARLSDLFEQTQFSGNLGGERRLLSHWVIDWRRFYDFRDFDQYPPLPDPAVHPKVKHPQLNMSRRIDTIFHLDLKLVLEHAASSPLAEQVRTQRIIAIRNLQRGFALGLPTGEEVASFLDEEPLPADKLMGGMPEPLPSSFRDRTPLWYYILKEAELGGGNRLGPVGGGIVAATLVEIIRHSRYSILRNPEWLPQFGRCSPETKSHVFGMVDLLHFADVVDPIGRLQGYDTPDVT